jgi:hypothetical protein
MGQSIFDSEDDLSLALFAIVSMLAGLLRVKSCAMDMPEQFVDKRR